MIVLKCSKFQSPNGRLMGLLLML